MKPLIIAIIAAIIIGTPIAIIHHNYMNPSSDLEYCLRNQPIHNYTNSREGACFTKEWPQYCAVIAPHLCPNATLKQKVDLLYNFN